MTVQPYKLYKSENKNAKNLVLIAGSAEGSSRWEPFLEMLLKTFNVVLIDNPGTGVAEYEADYSARTLAVRYQKVLEEVGVDEYFLLGHSFGSFIAQHMALNKPSFVKKLVLIGTSCGSFNQERIIKFQLESTAEFIAAGDDDEKQLEAFSKLFGENYPRENLPQYRVERTIPSKQTRFSYVLNSAKHANFKEILDLNTQTLIVQGKQDWIVDFENAEHLNSVMKNSQLLALDNVGHYPYLEDESVWPNILSFLQGDKVGVICEDKANLVVEELLKKDATFKSAISDENAYKEMLINIFINPNKLSVNQLHQQYIDFITG